MGAMALIVFLGSLGLGLASLAALACAGLGVWRTVRYGYKDFQAWSALLGEYMEELNGALGGMGERLRSIAEHGDEVREGVDEIRDVLEELRSHPLLRAARFAGRLRR